MKRLLSDHQCILGLADEPKKLREKVAKCKEMDAAAKTAFKGSGRKRAATEKKRMVALEAELAKVKTAHARLFDAAAQS